MKPDAFEEFLNEYFAKDYTGTDDDMPEAFEAWLEKQDHDMYLELANRAMIQAFEKGVLHGGKGAASWREEMTR